MSFDLQLAGRRALVTGGTRGAGAAVGKLYSRLVLFVRGLHRDHTPRSLPNR
jgi:NAD(P)-dependent dehydrogenase (short-subunit alcohol dehydrogenase family)